MPLDILLPIVIVPVLFLGGLAWYRRAMARIRPDSAGRELSGVRLTSEHLRRLPPPWRVVPEIVDDRLGSVDHVAIGPPGVVAITTVVADRPGDDHSAATTSDVVADTGPEPGSDTGSEAGPDSGSDAAAIGAAAVQRGPVADLLEPLGIRCDLLATVFWGSPQPDRPAATERAHGSVAVLGQRLDAWLSGLPADVLGTEEIDRAWAAVTTGIGRPDPLAPDAE